VVFLRKNDLLFDVFNFMKLSVHAITTTSARWDQSGDHTLHIIYSLTNHAQVPRTYSTTHRQNW
jgi:hypothetical protein